MKIAYTDPKNIRPATRQLLSQITEVVEEYKGMGYKMTLRQLYYQLVSKDIIPNQQKMYAKLSDMLGDARMCGQVDWDVIEDRVRVPKKPNEWDSIRQIVGAAAAQYRKDRHADQNEYVEVWVEKDALSGVLLPITEKYHVTLMVNRGYSSISAMHDAAKRFEREAEKGKDCHILYLGDHDPSGLDMIRDVSDRLAKFGEDVQVHSIALTMGQIEEHSPPPNPAKVSDPRAGDYIAQHGRVSWELDALRPDTLHELLEKNLEGLIDMGAYEEIIAQEEAEKQRLRDIISKEWGS